MGKSIRLSLTDKEADTLYTEMYGWLDEYSDQPPDIVAAGKTLRGILTKLTRAINRRTPCTPRQ